MEVTKHAPGTVCWIDLGTSDAEGAKRFYTQLFGWTADDMSAGDGLTYTMFSMRGKHVAALYQMPAEMKGVPPHWLTYVSVDDVEKAAERAKALGGTISMGPMDVLDAGRQVLLQDPTGAHFALWQPRRHIGAGIAGEPGALTWTELNTRDSNRAKGFYGELFGWKGDTTPMGGTEYTTFKQGDDMVAGMMTMTAEWGDAPPHWMVYLQVSDIEAKTAEAEKLGAKVFVPPTDVPGVGRFSLLQDPQGAFFSMIRVDM